MLEPAKGLVRWVGSFDFANPKVAFTKQRVLAVAANFGPGAADFGKGKISTAPNETDSVVFLIAP